LTSNVRIRLVSGAQRRQPLLKLRHCSMLWWRGWKNHSRKEDEDN
jgi:hypothetical protein